MSAMKHLLSQIFEGVHPPIPRLALGPNNQGGWRHAAAVDWSDHAKYRTEDRIHHLEEREDGPASCYLSRTRENPLLLVFLQ